MLQFIPLILSVNTRELLSNAINLAGDLETSARLDYLQDSVDTITAGIAHQSTMLSAIQSSSGAIGMTSAVGCALSAVNVFQLIQVQQKLNRMEKRLEDGFIDLKSVFSEKLENLLERQQQQRLAEAYSYYIANLTRVNIVSSTADLGDKRIRQTCGFIRLSPKSAVLNLMRFNQVRFAIPKVWNESKRSEWVYRWSPVRIQ